MTQKELNEAIKKCRWLSDNSGLNLVGGICRGMCMPCKRVIKRGKCEMLIELSKKLREEKYGRD